MSRLRQGFGEPGSLLSTVLALVFATALAAFAVVRGTWAVGGSDSSCYALMAEALAAGQWQPSSPLATQAPWPDASRTLAPGGFIPSTVRPDAAAPICAPGFSALMAPLAAIGGRDAIFWLTPIASFLLVWSAFVLARRIAGGLAGVSAAILTAASPIVLFQAVQPMNDITTAALWIAALAAGPRPLIAGLLTGLAILVRPNLAPLAGIVAAMHWTSGDDAPVGSTARFVVGVVPGVALLLALNQVLYGSVVGSGYGDASQLFSVSYVSENLSNYGRALYQTQTIFPLLALAAPFVFAGAPRRLALWLLAVAAAVAAIYLFYRPFPEWWYLRFLMPAIVLSIVVACSVAAHWGDRWKMRGVVVIGTVVLALMSLRIAGSRQVLALQELEGRYRDTAALVVERLPANAVLITVWESGSVRFHAGREAVLWDSLDSAWLDRAVTWLSSNGRVPYILLERNEERDFRERFKGQALGALDWPPRFNVGGRARIFDPADRARYLAGEAYSTENIRPPRRIGQDRNR